MFCTICIRVSIKREKFLTTYLTEYIYIGRNRIKLRVVYTREPFDLATRKTNVRKLDAKRFLQSIIFLFYIIKKNNTL